MMGGQPGGGQNVFQQSAAGLGQAGSTAAQQATYNPAQFGANVQQYQNPYTAAVTDATLSDLERQRQMAINTTGAQATQAGAFGGSRHGVAEAETNRGFGQIGANTLAGLNQQGFNTAAGNMFADQSRALGAANNLAQISNLGFGMGRQISQDQAQAGAQQQALTQSLIDAAKAQFGGFAGAPQAGLATQVGAVGSVPYSQSQSTTKTPGLFDFLSLALAI